MSPNPLVVLNDLGQSIWLDHIDRRLLDGPLADMIRNDRLQGLTSNPAIFEKAIADGDDYATSIADLGATGVEQIYQRLIVNDIGRAADIFRLLYDESQARDGYVSIEVSPLLALDTAGTIAEARTLWHTLGRPNVMIKVPGTRAGIPAIRQLIAEGINVNITLLFSVGRYVEVLDAYMDALEMRSAQGLPLDGIASVASFFLSRIDVKVDAMLDKLAATEGPQAQAAKGLRGRAAIACAAFAYRRFLEITATPRWQKLHGKGAMAQRLLWASTSTKDPTYRDIKYVEALIAQDTVNTLPMETLAAYRDHGKPALRIDEAMAEAPGVLHGLADLGIDLHAVDDTLEEEGIEKFAQPYRALLGTLEKLRAARPT